MGARTSTGEPDDALGPGTPARDELTELAAERERIAAERERIAEEAPLRFVRLVSGLLLVGVRVGTGNA